MIIHRKNLIFGALALLIFAGGTAAPAQVMAVGSAASGMIQTEDQALQVGSEADLPGAGVDVSTGRSLGAGADVSTGGRNTSVSVSSGAGASAAVPTGAKIYTVSSRKGCARFLRKVMLARKKKAYMYWTGSLSSLQNCIGTSSRILKMVFRDVRQLDSAKNPNDGDYLIHALLNLRWNGRTYRRHYLLTWNFTYSETKAQTSKVNQAANRVIRELGLHKSSALRTKIQNIRAIHNYVCQLVDYDYSGNPSHSAYAGLVSPAHRTVCQGYTGILYRFYQKLGIPVHIMNGWSYYQSDSTTHSWNIVRLGKKWYGIDATWDDTNRTGTYFQYTYFLKGTNTFNDEHILNPNYRGIYSLSRKKFNWKPYVS